MPIAHCVITSDCSANTLADQDLVDLWAAESSVDRSHMTVNLIQATSQFGKRYSVMATLLLPDLWSADNVLALQTGLAKALATHFNISPEKVHVITQLIASGLVVDDGQTVTWQQK